MIPDYHSFRPRRQETMLDKLSKAGLSRYGVLGYRVWGFRVRFFRVRFRVPGLGF